MFNFDFARIAAAAVCSLLVTTLAVGAAVDGHAATSAASAVYASADRGDSADG